MPTLLFLTDRSERHQQAAREAAPPEIEHIHFLRRPDKATILRAIGDADFLISERAGVIDGEIIAAGKRLRLIQRLGSLTYDIDLDAARAAGVPVCDFPIPGVVAVAEHLIWQILAVLRRAHDGEAVAQAVGDWGQSQRTDENIFATNWSRRTGMRSLLGMTVGVVGFGEIGVEAVRRLRAFGCRMLYHKRSPLPRHVEEALGIEYRTEDELYRQSDVLCNLLPYSPATDGLIGEAVFARMQPGSYLVNCGSGSIIDENALAAALRSGHLAGAALDTFEWEPIRPDNPLLPLARDPEQNVVLTPHTAFLGGVGSRREEFANIRRLLAGEPLHNRVAYT
jgi:phosphoglycerate dehydrogenase-like enzyme